MATKITRTVRDGFHIYQVDDGVDYWQLYRDYRDGKGESTALPQKTLNRNVSQIIHNGKKLVVKYDKSGWGRGSEGKLDLAFLKLVYGPFYSKLMYRVDKAIDAGCDVVQKIYMVAERRTGRYCHEAAIILEYIDGEELEKCPDETVYYPEVGNVIATLHRYGLAACDLASHNFIISPTGLKMIDLSCRGTVVIDQVKDAIRLKRHYGIALPMTTPFRRFAYFVISRYQAARKVYSRWRKNRRSARI